MPAMLVVESIINASLRLSEFRTNTHGERCRNV